VGCGPGSFAIPFAQAGAEVVAVDFSEAMIRRLSAETPPQLASRIDARVLDWHEVDLVAQSLVGAFDLVFANMTPAVSAPEGFLKLSPASRDWCLLTGWAGQRENVLEASAWRHFAGVERRGFGSDVIYPFNLLYAQGYLPEIDFEEVAWEQSVPVEGEAADLTEALAGQLKVAPDELAGPVRTYLEGLATDGMVRRRIEGITGQMLWQVGRRR
jgi:SAM-dependent methyltransferase